MLHRRELIPLAAAPRPLRTEGGAALWGMAFTSPVRVLKPLAIALLGLGILCAGAFWTEHIRTALWLASARNDGSLIEPAANSVLDNLLVVLIPGVPLAAAAYATATQRYRSALILGVLALAIAAFCLLVQQASRMG